MDHASQIIKHASELFKHAGQIMESAFPSTKQRLTLRQIA